MASDRLLGGFEHLLLLAILRLEDNSYGATVRRELIECADKDVAVGAIYTGLDRLEEKGFVDSWMGEPTAKRGGRVSVSTELLQRVAVPSPIWIGPSVSCRPDYNSRKEPRVPENLQPPRAASRMLACFGSTHLPEILGDRPIKIN